jgi:hypothetical protein
MHAPDSFVEKLEREFRGKLRIRWSSERNAWLIEQRMKRGLFGGFKPTRKGWDESSDKYVQTRDGVVMLMEVRTGTFMDCPKCGHELKVPFMETSSIRCSYCKLQGKEPSIAAVFIPLNDSLIDHLKSIDPSNPISERLAEDLDRANESLAAMMEKDALNYGSGAVLERFNRLAGIQQVGHTGKEKMWSR